MDFINLLCLSQKGMFIKMSKTKKKDRGKISNLGRHKAVRTLLDSRASKSIFLKGNIWIILAAVIPAVIMILVFRRMGMHPFGKGQNQFLVVDLWHQYYPFFRVVREKLVTGSSFLYSWETGLGTNFLSMLSYYAMSPLNWLAVFFSDERSRDVMMFILTAKIGLSGGFFGCFLKYTFKRCDASLTVFSVMYALCSYMLGYYWNVMWFDTVALMPLVALGIVAVCREKKWRLFTASLALSLISNYYIGYFTCIFSVLVFLTVIICEWRGVKHAFHRLWIMTRSAVLGIAIGGFILLPAYYGLQVTNSANNIFPRNMSWYDSWYDIFGNMLSFGEPSVKDGLPNFACGMLALLLFGAFLISPKIKVREKLTFTAILAFIAVSCNMNILNYIWHGFHVTNMIPHRFAFLFPFVLIAAGFRAYDALIKEGVKFYHLISMCVFPLLITWMWSVNHSEEVKAAINGTNNAVRKSLIISAVFLVIFIAASVIPVKNKAIVSYITSIFLCITVVGELYMNTVNGVKAVGYSGYNVYPLAGDNVRALLAETKKRETDRGEFFYRTEMKSTYTLNDGALYGYNGISQFSSAANVSMTNFMGKIGLYASAAGNRYAYRVSTPVINALFSIGYVAAASSQIESDSYGLTYYANSDNSYIYENNFRLPIGFMADPQILEYESTAYTVNPWGTSTPFDYQNYIMKLLTGEDENIYIPQPVENRNDTGITADKQGYGRYIFRKQDDSGNPRVNFTFLPIEGSRLYGYASNGIISNISLSSGGRITDSSINLNDYPITFPIGDVPGDDKVTLDLTFKSDVESGYGDVSVYALNTALWERYYSILASSPFKLTEFSDNKMKGTVNAQKDGVLYLSIPYEKGWSVYVDGKRAETVRLMDALLGVRVDAGSHEIELKYYPEGFAAGVTATFTSLALCVVVSITDKRRKNKFEPAAEISPNPDGKMDDVEMLDTAIKIAEVIEKSREDTPDTLSNTPPEGGSDA